LRRALGSATLIALAISWGEFNVTFLLATPSSGTFPTALYLTYTTNSFPVAAAATTLLLAGLVPLVLFALRVGSEPEQGA
jgi:ABC-type spermidine/putrescine transport system permease subunit II